MAKDQQSLDDQSYVAMAKAQRAKGTEQIGPYLAAGIAALKVLAKL